MAATHTLARTLSPAPPGVSSAIAIVSGALLAGFRVREKSTYWHVPNPWGYRKHRQFVRFVDFCFWRGVQRGTDPRDGHHQRSVEHFHILSLVKLWD
jgi:hypothetical protein